MPGIAARRLSICKESTRSPSRHVSTSSTDDTEAAEAAVEAIAGAANQEATFSLALTQDQKDLRDWVHGFAADVIRPAAHEWDEQEQTPWPIIQEAAKIGLYGFEGSPSSSPTRPA